jgi:peptidase A4-like protein
MEWKFNRARWLVTAIACGALLVALASTAHAAVRTHGNLLHITKPHLGLNAAQSNNWFGYNQGTLEQGGKLFNSITGDWTVPTATQHTAGQDEASSDWIGIGGGCIDAGCTVGDNTLIQTGTEQDVSGGKASYSAWWELVPVPSLTISSITVHPGDHMHAEISEVVPDADLWKITLQNVTTGQSFSTTVPYPSTHATAEWIEETPLTIGTSGTGLAALPNLSNTPFTNATVNGANANLKSSEEIQLIGSNGKVIGTPSAPNSTANGFTECAWATSC